MDWDDLRVFLHIARTGTIVDAVKSLAIDHSTASRRLARLEDDIGAKLFERAGRRLKITSAGKTLMSLVSRMESIVLRDIGGISNQGIDIAGKVRIGAPEGLGIAYLGRRLPTIGKAHPALELELVALPQNYSLASREVDIAITLDRPEVGSLSTRRLTDYHLGFFASVDYLQRQGRPNSIADLRQHTLCGYIPEMLHTQELNYLADPGLSLLPRLRSTSVLAQREMIESGAAIGVLPLFMAHDRPNLLQILPHEFTITRSYWLSVHEDLRALPRIRTVIDDIVNIARADHQIFLPPRK